MIVRLYYCHACRTDPSRMYEDFAEERNVACFSAVCCRGNIVMPNRVLLIAVLSLAFLSGCVERALVITSEPSGANVTVNQQFTGTTPFVVPFKHYGVYDIWIEHPGYEENGRMVKYYPLHVGEPIKAPGYQYTGVDFITEVMLPATLHDRHNLHYVLERVDQADDISDVLARAADLRDASRLRTEMRREKDAERGRGGVEETEPAPAEQEDSELEYQDGYQAPPADYDFQPDSDIDATPPDPTQMPVFSDY